MNFIMALEPDEFLALVEKAAEKRREDRAWEMYLTQLPYMTKKKQMSFEQYLAAVNSGKKVNKPKRSHMTPEAEAKFMKIAKHIAKQRANPM